MITTFSSIAWDCKIMELSKLFQSTFHAKLAALDGGEAQKRKIGFFQESPFGNVEPGFIQRRC